MSTILELELDTTKTMTREALNRLTSAEFAMFSGGGSVDDVAHDSAEFQKLRARAAQLDAIDGLNNLAHEEIESEIHDLRSQMNELIVRMNALESGKTSEFEADATTFNTMMDRLNEQIANLEQMKSSKALLETQYSMLYKSPTVIREVISTKAVAAPALAPHAGRTMIPAETATVPRPAERKMISIKAAPPPAGRAKAEPTATVPAPPAGRTMIPIQAAPAGRTFTVILPFTTKSTELAGISVPAGMIAPKLETVLLTDMFMIIVAIAKKQSSTPVFTLSAVAELLRRDSIDAKGILTDHPTYREIILAKLREPSVSTRLSAAYRK